MLVSSVPHAVLLSGLPSVGKAVLALDLAAALLCQGATGADRPCRACRACRMVEHGNHPDLHRIEPEGAGGQIRIGRSQHPEPGTVRWLVSQLALLPVEGGARVAIVRDAHRMNEDAQSALLKTLEEPPAATHLLLLADDEERLLPTVRSRCARLRLGSVAGREIERLLAELGLADAPTAARLARVGRGRPGVAVAYAGSSEAETVRGELVRSLLDLLGASRAARLRIGRDLVAQASVLAGALIAAPPEAQPSAARRKGRGAAAPPAAATQENVEPVPAADVATAEEGSARVPAAERRRALAVLLDLWTDLARDLALVEAGASGSVRDPALLEEVEQVVRELPAGAAAAAARRLVRARELLDGNVSPELPLDVLLLGWPRRSGAA
jgi:DNA polymerase III delta' subunit